MAHTYASNVIHCIFSTKDRRSLIPAARTTELYAYLGGIARGEGFPLIAAGGTANPIHLLFCLAGDLLSRPCCSEAERELFPVDGKGLLLAGRIRSIQRQSFAD